MLIFVRRNATPANYYTVLESFRGIAALSVAVHHLLIVNGHQKAFFAGSAIMVDFFFLLSGFVMTHAYGDKILNGLHFWPYLRARIARLYPLHLVLLLLWVPYILAKIWVFQTRGIGMDPAPDNDLISFVANLLMLHAMGLFDHLSWNYPAWSISVEFWAYIVFFLVLRFSPRRYLLVLLVMSLVSAIAVAILALNDPHHRGILYTYDYGFLRCLMSFGFGVGLYVLHKGFRVEAPQWLRSLIEIALFAACYVAVVLSLKGVAWQFAAIGVFAVTIFWFSDSKGPVSRVLSTRPMLYLGVISYSVYMTHAIIVAMVENVFRYIVKLPLVLDFAGDGRPPLDTPWAGLITLGTVALVIAFSSLTYRYIELPGKALGKPSRKSRKS